MKLLAIRRNLSEPLTETPQVDMLADSSIVLPRNPLFIPDIATAYTCAVGPAFRISRLGKHIGLRFAGRYRDAMAPLLRLLPDLPDTASAIYQAFDSAAALGSWIPVPEGDFTFAAGVSDPVILSADGLQIDRAIEILSRYFTLKNGDIIVPGFLPCRFTPEINSRFPVTVNSEKLLDLKFK